MSYGEKFRAFTTILFLLSSVYLLALTFFPKTKPSISNSNKIAYSEFEELYPNKDLTKLNISCNEKVCTAYIEEDLIVKFYCNEKSCEVMNIWKY